jgi:Phage integrase family
VSRTGKGPRYRLVFHPAVADDIDMLAAYGLEVVAAARAALDDLAHGRVTGKALGARRVSGDLTGLARVKLDDPGTGAQWFRLLYADIRADTRAILAIGAHTDWDEWKALLKEAGIRDARVHDARHTAATLLLAQGVDQRVVMEILGHSQISMTARYAHVLPQVMTDAADRIGQALWDQT